MNCRTFWSIAMLVSGCAASEPGPDVGVTTEGLIGANPVSTHPEVGVLWAYEQPCTATLIGKRAIITAAHCFEYNSDPGATATGVFTFNNNRLARNVQGYISLTAKEDPANDIAVAALDSVVDPLTDGVYWSEIAETFPDDPEEWLQMLGYGCEDFAINRFGMPYCPPDADFSVKRGYDVLWRGLADDLALSTDETGLLTIAVEGDSGGPVLRSNAVLLVLSLSDYAFGSNGQAVRATDRFGNVVMNNRRIYEALSALGL